MSNLDDPGTPVCAVKMESPKHANCDDTDLLSISCKLAHLSTDAVSKCLGLQESHVRDALKRVTERHQNHNKVHLLLIKWQEVNGDGATKSALQQCLQSLQETADNEPQRNSLSKYATEIGLQCCKPVGVYRIAKIFRWVQFSKEARLVDHLEW